MTKGVRRRKQRKAGRDRRAKVRRRHPAADLLQAALGYHRAGDLDRAMVFYRRVLAEDPEDASALHHLGLITAQRGDLKDATQLLQRAVASDPAASTCHNNLANLLRQQGRIEEAIGAYRAAIRCDPNYVNARFNLAALLFAQGDLVGAEGTYREVLRLTPRDVEAWNGLGGALRVQGRLEEALDAYRAALDIDPNHADSHNNLGFALQARGDMDAARAGYRRAVELDPGHPRAYENMVRTRRYGPEDRAEIERLEQLARNQRLTGDARVSLHFALGKVYDDCAEYAKAYQHFHTANRLQRNKLRFDSEAHRDRIARTIATFDRTFFATRSGYGIESTLPVFIVGPIRSGTTLVEQILASHPQVFGAGERMEMTNLARSLPARLSTSVAYPDCATRIDASLATSLAADHLQCLQRIGGTAERVVDKLPENFMQLGLIALLFPHARVIHCRREPLDVCLSIYLHRFAYGQPFAYDWRDIAVYYRGYERLMAHWRDVLPLEIHEIRYENLIADQEAVSRRLIDRCGLPWDPRCLQFHRHRRDVRTASNWQVRQPIYRDAVQRWKHYEPYLDELKVALATEFSAAGWYTAASTGGKG